MTGVSNRSLLSTSTPNGSAEPTPKDIPPTPGPKLWLDVDDGRGDDDSVR